MENSMQSSAHAGEQKPFSFKIPPGRNFGACSAEKSGRYSLANPIIYRGISDGNTYIASTNGQVLAVSCVDGEAPDKPVALPKPALKGNGADTTVTVNGEVRCVGRSKTSVHALPDPSGRFPQIKKTGIREMTEENYPLAIQLDTSNLAKIADVISANGCVTLLVPRPPVGKVVVTEAVLVLGHSLNARGGSDPYGAGVMCVLSTGNDGQDDTSWWMNKIRWIFNQFPDGDIYLESAKFQTATPEGQNVKQAEVKAE